MLGLKEAVANSVRRGRRLVMQMTVGMIVLVALAGIVPAWANDPLLVPPVYNTVDANGVNLSAGYLDLPGPSISVGPPLGQGGLSFNLFFSMGSFTTSLNGYIYSEDVSCTAVVMLQSHFFYSCPLVGSPVFDDQGNTLSFDGTIYTFTGRDGSVGKFDNTFNESGLRRLAMITSLTYPGGEVDTYHYQVIAGSPRLNSVTNNLGYQIKLNYECDTGSGGCAFSISNAIALNNAFERCDPDSYTCVLSGTYAWPTLIEGHSTTRPAPCDSSATSWRQMTINGRTTTSCSSFPTSTHQRLEVWLPSGRHLIYDITATGTVWPVYRVTDGSNSSQVWQYSILGSAMTVTDPLGHVQVVQTATDGSVLQIDIDPNSCTGGHLCLRTKIDRVNGEDGGLPTSVTFPEGDKIQYEYDSRGNLKTQTRISKTPGTPANIVTSAVYPSTCGSSDFRICNKPTSTTDANGNVTDYTYDAGSGNVLTVTKPADVNGGRPQTRYAYQPLYAWYKQDGSGSYSAAASPVYEPTQTSACSGAGACLNSSQEQRITTNYTIGSSSVATNLSPASVTAGAGDGSIASTVSSTYGIYGDIAQTTGPMGAQTEYFYNVDRQLTGVINPDPDGGGPLLHPATQTTYDSDGRVALVEQGTTSGTSMSSFVSINQSGTDYDVTFRAPKVKDTAYMGGTSHAVSVAQYSYDLAYNPLCTAVRNDPTTFGSLPDACTFETPGSNGPDQVSYNTYDAANRPLTTTIGYGSANPSTTSQSWTPDSTIATLTDGQGNVSQYSYNGFNRLTQLAFPDSTTGTPDVEQYGYDPNGNLTSKTLRAGGTISYHYDALNRLIEKDLPSGPVSEYRYSYDLLGDMLSAYEGSSGSTGLTYTYDALQRKRTETSNYGALHVVSSQYDAAGNRTCLTYPDGRYVLYGYDALNRMSVVQQGNATACGTGSATTLASYAYDNLSRVATLTRANGANTSASYDTTDPNWTLSQGGTLSPAVNFGLSYSPAGQILERTISNSAYRYAVPTTATIPYCANSLNQYATVGGSGTGCSGGTTFSYDGRGNLTSDGSTSYGYDVENRLVSASGAHTATLSYDPNGRLIQIPGPSSPSPTVITGSVWGTDKWNTMPWAGGTWGADKWGTMHWMASGLSGKVQLLYDGDALVAEYDAVSGALLRRYVPGQGVDETLVWYEGSDFSSPHWLHTDQQGSVIATSNSAGMATTMAYSADGEPSGGWGTGPAVPIFRYTGQAALPQIGLYYYKARIYDPHLGRFLQTDPVGYAAGTNLYAYAGNNPTNVIDPSGLNGLNLCYYDAISPVCESITSTGIPDNSGTTLSAALKILFGPGGTNTDTANINKPSQTGTNRGHLYKFKQKVCDASRKNSKCDMSKVNSAACVLPFSSSSDPVESGSLYWVNIFLVRTNQTGRYSFRNTTTWFHPFRGTIDRDFSQSPNGDIYVTTTGQGQAETQTQDDINQWAGPGIFRGQNLICSGEFLN